MTTPETPKRRSRRTSTRPTDSILRDAITPYLAIPRLRRLIAEQGDLYLALRSPDPPPDVLALLDLLQALLYPAPRDQITSPSEAAGFLLVDMSALDQEQLRTVLLDTKNRIQAIPTVYVGSLTTAMVRVGELFKDALKWNSAALIVAHNHPSGDPSPSTEDILLTQQIVEAGTLLDVDVLDHIIIGRGTFVSMREKSLVATWK